MSNPKYSVRQDPPGAQKLAEESARCMYDNDTASRALGIKIVRVAEDQATVCMTVRADMVNGHDICHGGMIFTLADSGFAFACNSRNRAAVASNCNIDFLRPALRGDLLTAQAEVSHRGKNAGLCDVSVRNQKNKLVSQFRGRFHLLHRPVIEPSGDGGAEQE